MGVFWHCFQTHLIQWSWGVMSRSQIHYRGPCNLYPWDMDRARVCVQVFILYHTRDSNLRKICTIRAVPSSIIRKKVFSMKKIYLWLSWEMFSEESWRKTDAWLDITEIFQACMVSGEFSAVKRAKWRNVKTNGLILPPSKFHMSKLSFIQT